MRWAAPYLFSQYANLIRKTISTEQLEEIDKCILLCRECHGIVHAQNKTAKLLIRVKVGKRVQEQTLKGQIVRDGLIGSITFLTNERVLVCPYSVQLGGKKPRILFGAELEAGRLSEYLKGLATYKTIVIRSHDKRLTMRAEIQPGNGYKLEHSLHFPIFKSELCKDEGTPILMWVRNGLAVTRDGEVIRDGVVTYEGSISEVK